MGSFGLSVEPRVERVTYKETKMAGALGSSRQLEILGIKGKPVYQHFFSTFSRKVRFWGKKTPLFDLKTPLFDLKTPLFDLKTPLFGEKTPLFWEKNSAFRPQKSAL